MLFILSVQKFKAMKRDSIKRGFGWCCLQCIIKLGSFSLRESKHDFGKSKYMNVMRCSDVYMQIHVCGVLSFFLKTFALAFCGLLTG